MWQIIFLILPLCITTSIHAQQPDSLSQTSDSLAFEKNADSLSVDGITYQFGFSEAAWHHAVDTTLGTVHYYDPVDRMQFQYRNTGVLGTPAVQMVYIPETEVGFHLGYRQYDLYRFTKHNVPFYHNTTPYSKLNFLLGQKKEQTFEVTYSQNIGRKFNFGFHYLRYATQGKYVNQRTRHNDLAFTGRFDSKKRYMLKMILLFNNIRAEENGGVKETNIFEDTSFVSKELVAVELENAENRQREISIHLHQSLRAGLITMTPDLIGNSNPVAFVPWEFYHEFDIARETFEYTDEAPDSAYYGLFYLYDTNNQAYLSEAKKVSFANTLGVRKTTRFGLIADLSAFHEFNFLTQENFDTEEIQHLNARFSLYNREPDSSGILYELSAVYSFLDYNKNDYNARASIGYKFGKFGSVKAEGILAAIEPDWLFTRFSFGSIGWNQTLNKQKIYSAAFTYELPQHTLRFTARYQRVSELPVWSQERLPFQYHGEVDAWMLELRKLFRIKGFGFDNLLRVQFISNDNLLRIPVYWGVHSLFYEWGMFKGNLLTRFGIDIRYNTNYEAYGYFPLTGQFHLQNEEQLTFYPAMDVYLLFKIKTVRIFLKMNHVNQGMFKDKGYFNAYKYPALDRNFHFGLSWMFLD